MTIRCGTCKVSWERDTSKYATALAGEKHADWCRDKPRDGQPY